MIDSPYFALIVGAGPAGIAFACRLKQNGVHNILIIDRNADAGGIWYSNSYPGCGCNIPSHFYSFSFAPNRTWSKPMPDRPEILTYLKNVMHDFDLDRHASYQTECVGATWQQDTSTWRVQLKDLSTQDVYTRDAQLFVTAVGLFNLPRYPNYPGLDTFKGAMWHSSNWNKQYDVSGKKVAVVGSGASAMQIIPSIAPETKELIHFPGGKRYILKQDNEPYSNLQKWCFRNVPFWAKMVRTMIFWSFEFEYLEHLAGILPRFLQRRKEAMSRKYVHESCPSQYHDQLLPTHTFGCKRHVMDLGYLECLKSSDVDVASTSISHIDERGITTTDGCYREFDCIILATGFYATKYLEPMEIQGTKQYLHEYWAHAGGPRAYNSVSVPGFPNMAILFGPNGASGHSSAIFNIEVQVNYAIDVYVKTLMRGLARSVDVKPSALETQLQSLQKKFEARKLLVACSEMLGVNMVGSCVAFPGSSLSLWRRLMSPGLNEYILRA